MSFFGDLPHFHLREGLIETPAEAGASLSYTITAIVILFFIICNDDKKSSATTAEETGINT